MKPNRNGRLVLQSEPLVLPDHPVFLYGQGPDRTVISFVRDISPPKTPAENLAAVHAALAAQAR